MRRTKMMCFAIVIGMVACVIVGITQKKADFTADIVLRDEVAEEITIIDEKGKIDCSDNICVMDIEEKFLCATVAEEQIEVDDIDYAVYEINGKIDPYHHYLAAKLDEVGLIDFYPYAECQSYQESRWDPEARHLCADGSVDIGYLQFNSYWWDDYCKVYGYDGDIYDPYDQIDLYVLIVADAYENGEILCNVISNHYTGGVYYNPDYVDDVLAWTEFLIRTEVGT